MRLPMRLLLLWGLTTFFSLSGNVYSYCDQLREIWYFSDTPLSKALPGIVQVLPADLIQKRSEIMVKASGLVFPYTAFEMYEKNQLLALRDAVTEEWKFVFVVGSNVPANYVQRKLKIVRKVGFLEERISKWRIVADGLYRDPSGLINGINVLVIKDVTNEFVLQEVRDAIIRSMKIQDSRQSEKWEKRASQKQVFADPPYGKYTQVVTPHILRGKPAPYDYWYTRLENTATPGLVVYKSGFGNSFNSSTFDILSSLSLLCHGPTGVVGPNQTAEVSVGCPGPTQKWQWDTGATQVIDKTNTKSRKGQWDLNYDSNGQESKKEHQWIPGLEEKNEKNKQLVMGIDSLVKWVDRGGTIKECEYTWPYNFVVDP